MELTHRLSVRAIRLGTLLVAVCLPVLGRSQDELWVSSLQVEDGLSQNFVETIAQDRDGFMWFGTLGGLSRWDGYRFSNYTHDFDDESSLSDSVILALHADKANNLWVGTSKGIDLFDSGANSFRRYGHLLRASDGASQVRVQRITSDAAGRVWFASCDGASLYRLDPRTGRVSNHLIAGTAKQLVTVLYVDHADRLWVAMQAAGSKELAAADRGYSLYVLDRCSELGEGPLPPPRTPLSLDNEGGQVEAVTEDKSHRLWFGRAGGGLLRFDPSKGTVDRMAVDPSNPKALANGFVHRIGIDPMGVLWVLTRPPQRGSAPTPGQLHRVDPETMAARGITLRQSTVHPGGDALLESLTIDHSGVLWLGSNAGGLRYADVSSGGFVLYRKEVEGSPGLNSSFVRAIWLGRDGALWVGTPQGLNRIDRLKRQIQYPTPELTGQNIQAIREDREGNLWVGTSSGLAVVEQLSGKVHYYRHDDHRSGSLSDNFVQVIHEDRDGIVWLGLLNGLDEFDPRTRSFRNHPIDPGNPIDLPSGTIYALYTDRRHDLWVGTAAGLAKLESKSGPERRFQRIATGVTELGGVAILSLCESVATPEVLWVGTNRRGLCRLDLRDYSCRFYTSRNSDLPDDTIYGTLADARGRLWMSTNRGLVCYDPTTGTFRTYGPQNGLQSSEFNGRAYFQGPDGEMFFGGVGGLNSFFPQQIISNPYEPQVFVTEVRILDRYQRNPELASKLVYRHGMARQELKLSPRQRDISFDYVALHFSDSANQEYIYKLDNYDTAWRRASSERKARYTNLDPGRYTFHVKARSGHGVWSTKEDNFSFIILPPVHATPWFGAMLALAVVSTLAGGYQWRVRNLRKRQQLLEQKVAQRTEQLREQSNKLRELDTAKSKFFANISHEFRTPLTLTLGPLRDVATGLHGSIPAEARAEIDQAIVNTSRQLELVDQLLLLARFDAGLTNLRPRELCLDEFLRLAVAPYESLAKRQQTQFLVNLPASPVYGAYDEGKLEQVVRNLLGNAFKFTPSGGTVSLRMTTGPGELAVIEVEDTGPGIPVQDLPYIFERFYRGDQELGSVPGAGIGLALAKDIVELHGGQICAENRPEGGARFTVRLKTNPGHWPTAVGPAVFQTAGTSAEEPASQRCAAANTPPVLQPDSDAGEPQESEAPQKLNRPKVLLVEDNSEMRAYLRKHLAPHYELLEVAHGDDGLRAARDEMPDVIVSDVMMPGMDGYALCRAIKSDPETDFIPVILLSAKASPESRVEGLEGGADDYIPKPFDAVEFRLRIRNLLAARTRLKARFSAAPAPIALPESAGNSDSKTSSAADGLTTGAADSNRASNIDAACPSRQPSFSPPENALAARVRAVLERESQEESFDVVALARNLGMSRAHVHRRINEGFGVTPSELIIRFRLERAAELLRQRAGNVGEVAYSVGFKNLSHFVKRFRQHYGQTPAAYAAARSKENKIPRSLE